MRIKPRYGRLLVIETGLRTPPMPSRPGVPAALCRCTCPARTELVVALCHLRSGHTSSCGCVKREKAGKHIAEVNRSPEKRALMSRLGSTPEMAARLKQNGLNGADALTERNQGNQYGLTHGLSHHPLYKLWYSMLYRCEDPRCRFWKNYGGRGIKVCPEWHDGRVFFEYIERELGPRPAGHSLDRIENDGNYEPGNVRWADKKTQANNRRNNVARKAGDALCHP